jgi:hypothetical protein
MPFDPIDPTVAVVAGVAVLSVLVAILVSRPRNGRARSRLVSGRVECPVHGRPAFVSFVVAANDGEAYVDVATCSLLPPDEPPECGKVCRSASVAPFAEARRAGP